MCGAVCGAPSVAPAVGAGGTDELSRQHPWRRPAATGLPELREPLRSGVAVGGLLRRRGDAALPAGGAESAAAAVYAGGRGRVLAYVTAGAHAARADAHAAGPTAGRERAIVRRWWQLRGSTPARADGDAGASATAGIARPTARRHRGWRRRRRWWRRGPDSEQSGGEGGAGRHRRDGRQAVHAAATLAELARTSHPPVW